jgi:effector-binding domain-containing protein
VEFPGGAVCALELRGPLAEVPDRQLEFIALVEARGIEAIGPLTALFEDDPGAAVSRPLRYTLMVRVPEGTIVDAPLAIYRMPDRRTAGLMVQGTYPHRTDHQAAILAWIERNGWRRSGPFLHVYRKHRAWNIPERRYLTEVHLAVEPAR